MCPRKQTDHLVPGAEPGLERLKYEVAEELGFSAGTDPQAYQQGLERFKWEAAADLGLADQIRRVGWGNISSRDCGRVGGAMGGRIGGQMVKRLIRMAEERMEQ